MIKVALFLTLTFSSAALASCEDLLATKNLISNGLEHRLLLEKDIRTMLDLELAHNPLRDRTQDARGKYLSDALDKNLAGLNHQELVSLKNHLASLLVHKERDEKTMEKARIEAGLLVGVKQIAEYSNYHLREEASTTLSDGRVVLLATARPDAFLIFIDGIPFTGQNSFVPNPKVFFPMELSGGKLGLVQGTATYDLNLFEIEPESFQLTPLRDLPRTIPNVGFNKASTGRDADGRPYILRTIGPVGGLRPETIEQITYADDGEQREVSRTYQFEKRYDLVVHGEKALDWFGDNTVGAKFLASDKVELPNGDGAIAAIAHREAPIHSTTIHVARRGKTYSVPIETRSNGETPVLGMSATPDGHILTAHTSRNEKIVVHSFFEGKSWSTELTSSGAKQLAWVNLRNGRALLLVLTDQTIVVFEPLVSNDRLQTFELPAATGSYSKLRVLNYKTGEVDVAIDLFGGVFIFSLARMSQ